MATIKSNRRGFIKSATLIGAGASLIPTAACADEAKNSEKISASALQQPKPKKILILGGTGFIGPNMVKYAKERGHEVTIFSRGNRESEVDGVEHLIGDRNNDLSALEGRKWDVVMDNNTYDYKWVQLSTEKLKDAVDHYIFVSSISAYDLPEESRSDKPVYDQIVDENYNRFKTGPNWKDGDEAPYGLMKAICENIAHEAFPGRTTVVRPGLIIGPGDKTDRWTYWPVRIAEGGEVLAPGNPQHANQVIDQRDLTEWIVRLAENGAMGNFNGVGPASRMSMGQMLGAIWGGVGGDATFTWVDEQFLEEQGVGAWQDMPSWIPGDPLMFCTNQKSIEAGLRFRPLAQTAADTLAWDLNRPEEERNNRRAGLSREREKEVLDAWASGNN
ncbi:MAG: NAD-dependent epimerase/dehydratase family protein [Cyclobacteriaceae bacterium]